MGHGGKIIIEKLSMHIHIFYLHLLKIRNKILIITVICWWDRNRDRKKMKYLNEYKKLKGVYVYLLIIIILW